MYRWKVTGTDSTMRVLTVIVTAACKETALDLAFDDMGLICVSSVRKHGSQLKSFWS